MVECVAGACSLAWKPPAVPLFVASCLTLRRLSLSRALPAPRPTAPAAKRLKASSEAETKEPSKIKKRLMAREDWLGSYTPAPAKAAPPMPEKVPPPRPYRPAGGPPSVRPWLGYGGGAEGGGVDVLEWVGPWGAGVGAEAVVPGGPHPQPLSGRA